MTPKRISETELHEWSLLLCNEVWPANLRPVVGLEPCAQARLIAEVRRLRGMIEQYHGGSYRVEVLAELNVEARTIRNERRR